MPLPNPLRRNGSVAAFLLLAALLAEAGPYVGSAACGECHRREAKEHALSPHARHATPAASPDWEFDAAVGSNWMQAYLRRDEKGYHRILPLCYDLREKRWREVEPVLEEIRGRREGLDASLRGRLASRSFELDCSGCHSSQATLRMDPSAERMEAHWEDLAINCESCHGPGGRHTEAWRRLDATAPMARLERLSPREKTALCARCHGGPPTVGDYAPADAAHFIGVLEDREGFFPDGTASGQVYQHAGFVRSPCAIKGGLSCADCHESHGPGLRAAAHADARCTTCHEGYAREQHVHHDLRGEGARCVSCHMPRLLSGVMAHQRDHRIGLPLPASPHVPDACTACHTDRTKEWADTAYRAWWGKAPVNTLRAIEAIVLARRGDPEATPLLQAATTHPDGFFRAAAALYLKDPGALLGDSLPEVRLAALRAAEGRRDAPAHLERALRDREPVIRAQAALMLHERGLPPDPLWNDDLAILARQWRDAAGARLLLGVAAMQEDRPADALAHFETAVVFRPWATDGWLGIASAQERLGRDTEARAAHRRLAHVLRERLAERPADGEVAEAAVRAFLRAGDVAAARAVLQFAMDRAPTERERARLREVRALLAAREQER